MRSWIVIVVVVEHEQEEKKLNGMEDAFGHCYLMKSINSDKNHNSVFFLSLFTSDFNFHM